MASFAFNDLTVGQLCMLVEKVGGRDRVLQILSGKFKIQLFSTTSGSGVAIPDETEQFLTVEADISFEDRIKRGNYGCCNSDLIEKKFFPITAEQVGDWEWKLFHFDRSISSEEAIRLMEENGYAAGQIGHILAFGEKYPEEQRKFPIIGLGSVAKVNLNRYVPVLWVGSVGRSFRLAWFDGVRGRLCRFLGVRRRSVG